MQNNMRDRLVKLIEDSLPNDNHIYFTKDIETMADCLIANDVVPVVRCSQCKYWNNGDCYRIELTRPDDYCSYGRKEDEWK